MESTRHRTQHRSRAVLALRLLLLLLMLTSAMFADWHSIGNLKPLGRKGNEFTFASDKATVVITVLAPDVVRVRAVAGRSLPPDHSYAVVKTDWPAVKVESTSNGNLQSIRTDQMEVRVQLSPFRVAFYDTTGPPAFERRRQPGNQLGWPARARLEVGSSRRTLLRLRRKEHASRQARTFAGDVEQGPRGLRRVVGTAVPIGAVLPRTSPGPRLRHLLR